MSLVDHRELTVEVTRRIPLTELADLHGEATAGQIVGKVITLPA